MKFVITDISDDFAVSGIVMLKRLLENSYRGLPYRLKMKTHKHYHIHQLSRFRTLHLYLSQVIFDAFASKMHLGSQRRAFNNALSQLYLIIEFERRVSRQQRENLLQHRALVHHINKLADSLVEYVFEESLYG